MAILKFSILKNLPYSQHVVREAFFGTEIQEYILKDLTKFNGEEYCLAIALRKILSINLSVKWSELLNVK